MSKKDNLSDYLSDLYQGIARKRENPSRNPQDFRREIELIETKSPEWDGSYETSPDTEILGAPRLVKKTVTENKTYYASDDGADGYSEVSVAVPIPDVPEVTTEERTVIPTKAVQVVTPQGADYLSKVTVEPIPDAFIQPADNKHITENGENIDVREFATVSVDVASLCDRPLAFWFMTQKDQVLSYDSYEGEDGFWYDEEIYSGIKESITVPPQVQDGSATSFSDLFSYFTYDDYYGSYVDMSVWAKKICGVINCEKVTSLASMFYNAKHTEEICPIINTEKVTSYNHMFWHCEKLLSTPTIDMRGAEKVNNMFMDCYVLETVDLKNIKISLAIDSCHALTVDSLVGLCYELINTGSTKTLTIGSTNLAKLADVYVKSIPITDEMRAEDDLIDGKMPFVRCESADEGAMLITSYVTAKNWSLR